MNELKKIDEAFGKALAQNPEIAEKIRQGKRKEIKQRKSIEAILLKLGDDLANTLLDEE